MSETSGVCVIVPFGQDGFRPHVIGMGILVGDREVVTCAHVVGLALDLTAPDLPYPAVVRVCFPFTPGPVCINGMVDPARWFPPGKGLDGEVTDVAVIKLDNDAPTSVQRVSPEYHVIGAEVRVYGFRGKLDKYQKYVSDSYGQWATGEIVGLQPGGRAQFDGRHTGASIEKGYSGGGVYETRRSLVVGMITEADRDQTRRIAQFIDGPTLMSALGRVAVNTASKFGSSTVEGIARAAERHRRTLGPWQVPPPPADFLGRSEDIAIFLAHFDKGAAILGIHGLGGVGKTTLALVLAQRLAGRYPDGQIFLDLLGVSENPLSWREGMGHVIHSFLPEERLPDTDAALKGLFLTVLQGKRVLLLMDNVADAKQVEPLRPPETCALIVTSRRWITLPGALTRGLAALPPADAEMLLCAITPRVAVAAGEVAELCGRLPIALRLAGTLLAERPDLAVSKYVQRLRVARLSERSGLAEVDAAIRLSEKLLPKDVRRKWRELAVLVGAFESTWAASVWGVDEDLVDDWLGILQRNSMLEWDGQTNLYRLHDLVREFAEVRLTQDQRREAQRRHAQHFLKVLNESTKSYISGGDGGASALQTFDRAWANAEAAQNWAGRQAGEADAQRLCMELLKAGVSLLNLRRHPQERIGWWERALAAARFLGDRRSEGDVLVNLGLGYMDLGQPARAIDLYEQYLTIARELGDRPGEGAALGNKGLAYAVLGLPQRAAELHGQDLVIARETGTRDGEGRAQNNLGLAYMDLGRPQLAIERFELSLAICREIRDRLGESASLNTLGLAYKNLGQPQRAIEYHELSLTVCREVGDLISEGRTLSNLGLAYEDLGQPLQAIDCYELSRSIFRKIGDRQGEADVCWNWGKTLVELGRLDQAIQLLEVRIALLHEKGQPNIEQDAAWIMELKRQRADNQSPQ